MISAREHSVKGKMTAVFFITVCRINGAEDKLTYANELFRLQQELREIAREIR